GNPIYATFSCLLHDLTTALIFFAIWHSQAFDELKTDYRNPVEQCDTLNPLVCPKHLTRAFSCVMLLCAAEWLTLGPTHPSWQVTSGGLCDPTTITNADVLAHCWKEGWCNLAFYLLAFFYYLYSMIYVWS
uniref:Uncharacterized protein n=1 Tax=Prolemur simus TaxID=1328070 RepID=A0A8C8YHG8_PROSS